MNRALHHARQNAIAYLALFVALGGTGYAAINLPAGSVGEKQIQNHAIGPAKLNPRYIGGNVRHWATVTFSATKAPTVIDSSSRAKVSRRLSGVQVTWGDAFSARCAAIATVRETGFEALPPVGFVVAGVDGSAGLAFVTTHDGQGNTAPEPFTVVVVC